jgi:hypothetical protein
MPKSQKKQQKRFEWRLESVKGMKLCFLFGVVVEI